MRVGWRCWFPEISVTRNCSCFGLAEIGGREDRREGDGGGLEGGGGAFEAVDDGDDAVDEGAFGA